MPVRKTKRTAAADTDADRRADDLAAAADAEAATVVESVEAAADVTRAEDEAATAATFSALSEAAAERGTRDAAQGAATFSMADEVAAGGEITAALSSDEFRRGMELAGIAGQVQVAADLLGSVGQPTLAAFLGRTSHQLRGLAVGAIGRATEGAVVAHGAQHLASRLAALGLSEMHEGRDEYASSAALGAASAEIAADAVRSAAAGAAELAAATAMGGLAEALATEGADHPAQAGGADQGAPGTTAAATPRVPKPSARASSRRAPRKPAKPKK
jgi:hypothetical protein